MNRDVTILCVATAAAVAGPDSAAYVPPRTPAPATLVLRRADLGAGYAGRGGTVDNGAAARGSPPGVVAKLAYWGRVDGYEVDFTRRATPATLQDGPLAVTSSASVYRSESGARAAFAYSGRYLVPGGDVPLPLGFSVGQEARQWVSGSLGTTIEYIVIWRERTIDASIALTGRVGVVSAGAIAPLVLKQDARIRAALRSGRSWVLGRFGTRPGTVPGRVRSSRVQVVKTLVATRAAH